MLKKTAITILFILFAIQLIPLDKSNPKVDERVSLKADEEVMRLLKRSCYDCHSFETKWPSYAAVAPLSFFISGHVRDARKALNFSLWDSMDEKIKVERLKRAVVTVNNEMMALPSYLVAHEDARLRAKEKEVLTHWFEEQLKELYAKEPSLAETTKRATSLAR